eukprot:c19754_g1_i4 orf=16-228(-)
MLLVLIARSSGVSVFGEQGCCETASAIQLDNVHIQHFKSYELDALGPVFSGDAWKVMAYILLTLNDENST